MQPLPHVVIWSSIILNISECQLALRLSLGQKGLPLRVHPPRHLRGASLGLLQFFCKA